MSYKEIVWDEKLLDILCKATHRHKDDLKYLIVSLSEQLKIELPGKTAS